MRAYDFSPLFRSIVGFDRLSSLLDAAMSQGDDGQGYPPYNIVKLGENDYRITMAVAGFGERDLELVAEQNTLTVRGRREEDKNGNGNAYLYRGIAGRSFERRFQLADHIKVTNANLVNGLLSIDLVRELPEAMKPRTIQITAANGGQSAQPTQIEGESRKAA